MNDLYKSRSDEELVVLLLQQDHQAFSTLVHRHASRFYACAYRYCNDQDEAEDIVQNCFLKLWAKPALWKPGKNAKFTTWFYRIVANAAIDAIRVRRSHMGQDVLDVQEDQAARADRVLEEQDKMALLDAAIEVLPDRQKSALNLCFYEELSHKEVAEIMGVGVKAVESLLSRAKRSLGDQLYRMGVLERDEKGGQKYG